jgi:hypothetical protein
MNGINMENDGGIAWGRAFGPIRFLEMCKIAIEQTAMMENEKEN